MKNMVKMLALGALLVAAQAQGAGVAVDLAISSPVAPKATIYVRSIESVGQNAIPAPVSKDELLATAKQLMTHLIAARSAAQTNDLIVTLSEKGISFEKFVGEYKKKDAQKALVGLSLNFIKPLKNSIEIHEKILPCPDPKIIAPALAEANRLLARMQIFYDIVKSHARAEALKAIGDFGFNGDIEKLHSSDFLGVLERIEKLQKLINELAS